MLYKANQKVDNGDMEMRPYANNLDKLKAGTLFRSIQKENSEPENIALGQVSKELAFLQRQSQYVNEIERVLKELKLTVSLIRNSKGGEVPEEVSRQELLAYHQGNFLTLVHQMKDKIIQLVHLMTETTIPDKPSIEYDMPLADLLRRKRQLLQEIGEERVLDIRPLSIVKRLQISEPLVTGVGVGDLLCDGGGIGSGLVQEKKRIETVGI